MWKHQGSGENHHGLKDPLKNLVMMSDKGSTENRLINDTYKWQHFAAMAMQCWGPILPRQVGSGFLQANISSKNAGI